MRRAAYLVKEELGRIAADGKKDQGRSSILPVGAEV
jgi:hypothetical protein